MSPRGGDCWTEGALGCAVATRVEIRPRRGTGQRAKSLTDCHIDDRVLSGPECRSHPGSDSRSARAFPGLVSDFGRSRQASPSAGQQGDDRTRRRSGHSHSTSGLDGHWRLVIDACAPSRLAEPRERPTIACAGQPETGSEEDAARHQEQGRATEAVAGLRGRGARRTDSLPADPPIRLCLG